MYFVAHRSFPPLDDEEMIEDCIVLLANRLAANVGLG